MLFMRANCGAFSRLLLLAGLVAGLGCHAAGRSPADSQPRPVTARGELGGDERNNIDVFKLVAPSVVHITTLESETDLFTMNTEQVPRGTGTGFVWDKDGDIITNYHVIENADAAKVTLADQSTYKATLVGAFPDRDIAVLHVAAPADKLKPIMLGQSGNLQVGQKVLAIGNPFGLDQTLTTGIVSALGRQIESVTRRPIRGVIQTDAAINPGNSGGPLLDSAGRLIGVNTMIYSPSGASAGIGFAIPVDEVNRVVPRLIRDGRYVRPTLGVSAAPPDFNRQLGLPEGVAVIGFGNHSPAAAAGLHPFMRNRMGNIVNGDIITAVDGKPVTSDDGLTELMEGYKVGQEVTLRVWR
ncbi:MAG: trypsin-like peptidase domain-containing protein, partial [Burkholderiales bacterium]|nr:trypsin-like peptidase domain-containing protein [Burkholderiales bacterium]